MSNRLVQSFFKEISLCMIILYNQKMNTTILQIVFTTLNTITLNTRLNTSTC